MLLQSIFSYQGVSMTGTFYPGDILTVCEISFDNVYPGDVVAFRTPGDNAANLIVHRVVARIDDKLITRGDACATPDANYVQACNLIGHVTQVQRGSKSYSVWGGFTGQLWARYVRLRRRLLSVGRTPYRWLRASGIVRRLWHPPFARVTLATTRGPVVKTLCGGKTVAVWEPGAWTYWCRKPYDLVLESPLLATNSPRINE